ncbi:MAG TPA: hypothetical protein VMR62_08765 [Bryobacteraceae bacterium]|nr:hypothetical protein [Bryobacteraceae bacterium]
MPGGCTLGRLFGNDAIWTFGGPSGTQLNSPGSVQWSIAGQLMRSREFWLMTADTSNTYLTAGYGSGLSLSVLSRGSDAQTMLAYVPNGNAASIIQAVRHDLESIAFLPPVYRSDWHAAPRAAGPVRFPERIPATDGSADTSR